MKDEKRQEAGDDAEQYQAGRDIIIHRSGVSRDDARAIAHEVFERRAWDLAAGARALIEDRIAELNDRIIARMHVEQPGLLARFRDPHFLGVLANVQKSHAESFDETLGDVLAGIVIKVAAAAPRSRRDIILRQAIDCAQFLTQNQLYTLAARTIIGLEKYEKASTVGDLIQQLDSELRACYGKFCGSEWDYNHLLTTAPGVIRWASKDTIDDPWYHILATKPAVMHPIFSESEIPDEILMLRHDESFAAAFQSVRETAGTSVAPSSPEGQFSIDPQLLERFFREAAVNRVNEAYEYNPLSVFYDTEQNIVDYYCEILEAGRGHAFVELAKEREIGYEGLRLEVLRRTPDLAEFLDAIANARFMQYVPSDVGLALAHPLIEISAPTLAVDIETYLSTGVNVFRRRGGWVY